MRSGYGGVVSDLIGNTASGTPHQPDTGGSDYGGDPDNTWGKDFGYVTRAFDDSGVLATGVYAVEVTFFPQRTPNDDFHYRLPTAAHYPLVREIDVYGTAIPEPSSIIIWLLLGAVGLFGYGRNRRKQSQ